MLNLTHALRWLVLMILLLVSLTVQADIRFKVDENYCSGLSLMAKATSEAFQRKEPIEKWRRSLNILKGDSVKDKDNVLYYILPQAVTQVNRIYKAKQKPMDTYVTEYNRCMSEQYGELIVMK